MPMLSVEPTPLPPSELRRFDPLDAHDASYLAASARIFSFSMTSTPQSIAITCPAIARAAPIVFRQNLNPPDAESGTPRHRQPQWFAH